MYGLIVAEAPGWRMRRNREGGVGYLLLPKDARAFLSRSTVSLSPGYQYSRWQFSHATSRSAAAWNTAFTSLRSTASSVARATFLSASILASHRTGSLSSFALIAVGDSSGAFGPTLL